MPNQSVSGIPNGQKTRGQKILVVDDNDAIRNLLTSVLERSGFVAATAADGMEGLEKVTAEPFDLVVTDIEMAPLDGIEMIRQLRLQLHHQELPILVQTANPAHVTAALNAGANDVILKPYEISDLITSIDKMIRS